MVDLLVPIVFRVATSKIRPKGARIVAIVDAYDALTTIACTGRPCPKRRRRPSCGTGPKSSSIRFCWRRSFAVSPRLHRLCRQNADPSSAAACRPNRRRRRRRRNCRSGQRPDRSPWPARRKAGACVCPDRRALVTRRRKRRSGTPPMPFFPVAPCRPGMRAGCQYSPRPSDGRGAGGEGGPNIHPSSFIPPPAPPEGREDIAFNRTAAQSRPPGWQWRARCGRIGHDGPVDVPSPCAVEVKPGTSEAMLCLCEVATPIEQRRSVSPYRSRYHCTGRAWHTPAVPPGRSMMKTGERDGGFHGP